MERDVTIRGRTIKRALQVLLGLLLLAGLVLALIKVADAVGGDAPDAVPAKVQKDRYQSVQLADGRLLIGKVRDGDAQFLQLRDAHFIQQVPPEAGKKQAQPQREVKSISEQLQGPEGDMLINREQIVSIENLRTDSQAVRAIEQISGGGD